MLHQLADQKKVTFVKKDKKKQKTSKVSTETKKKSCNQPVVEVDSMDLPSQATDVTPINPVGFQPAGTEYVRPVPDPIEVPNQKFWVISYVTSSTEGIRSKNTMVKCSGAYEKFEDADKRANEIRQNEPRINVFVVDMYVFLTVPIPKEIFEGLRKHYMDEKLDRIMYENYLEVQRERKRMDERIMSDKKKAIQNMRTLTGNESYTPTDHTEFIQQQLKQESELAKSKKNEQLKFQSSDIVGVLDKIIQSVDKSKEDTVKAFATELLEKLVQQKIERKAEMDNEQAKCEAAESAAAQQKHVPASSGYYNATTNTTDDSIFKTEVHEGNDII
ncbi:MAG: hypothetical protein PHN45_01960 [Methylococcales bacterium]|nr:hypothetical protein [Methylococcales bacterium]